MNLFIASINNKKMSESALRTWKDINEYLDNNNLDDKNRLLYFLNHIDYESEDLQRFEFEIQGQDFHSAITTGIAQALIEFQQNLYKALDAIANNHVPKRAPRTQSQIVFYISDGCTRGVTGSLLDKLKDCLHEAKQMNPKQLAVVGFAVWAILFTVKGIDLLESCKANQSEIQKAQYELQKHEADVSLFSDCLKDIIDVLPILARMNNDTLHYVGKTNERIKSSFFNNVPIEEIESINLSGKTYTQDQIRTAVSGSTTSTFTRVTGIKKAKPLKMDCSRPGLVRIAISLADNEKPVWVEALADTSQTSLFDDGPRTFSSAELQSISAAMIDERFIKLNLEINYDENGTAKDGRLLDIPKN